MLIDSHLHLEQYDGPDLDRAIAEWREQGVAGVVAVSKDLASSYRTLELKNRYPDFVWAAVGYHPEQPLPSESELAEIFSLIECHPDLLSAIGEVGLPHYTGFGPLESYQEILHAFALLANRYDLPLAIHAVHDKAGPALDILRAAGVKRAHFHWLKAPEDVVAKIVGQGYFISVTPEVCYRSRDQALLQRLPLNLLLLETDGPWPFDGPFAGRVTTPVLLRDVVRKVAELKQANEDEIIRNCWRNALACYSKGMRGYEIALKSQD